MKTQDFHALFLKEIAGKRDLLARINIGPELDINRPRTGNYHPQETTTSIFDLGLFAPSISSSQMAWYAAQSTRHRLAEAVINSEPRNFMEYKEPGMTGLCKWPGLLHRQLPNTEVYRDMDGQPLTLEALEDWIESFWMHEHADFQTGSWAWVVYPELVRELHELPYDVSKTVPDESLVYLLAFHSKRIGQDFPIIPDLYMPNRTILFLNLDAPYYGFLKDGTFKLYDGKNFSCQTYGVVIPSPRQNIAMMWNIGGYP